MPEVDTKLRTAPPTTKKSSTEPHMKSSRRTFPKESSLLMAGAALTGPFSLTAARSELAAPIADTTYGKLRGRTKDGIHVVRGVSPGTPVFSLGFRGIRSPSLRFLRSEGS